MSVGASLRDLVPCAWADRTRGPGALLGVLKLDRYILSRPALGDFSGSISQLLDFTSAVCTEYNEIVLVPSVERPLQQK